jgi:hypothetical protein
MADEQKKNLTINEEAGLPDNWVPIDAKPIVPSSREFGGYPTDGSSRYLQGSLPPGSQHDTSFVGTAYRSSNSPQLSVMPLSPSGLAQVNAAAQTVATEIVSKAIAAIPSPSTEDIELIAVNRQLTSSFYVVQSTDRNTVVSMANNAGGAVVLPPLTRNSNSNFFDHAVSGIGEGPNQSPYTLSAAANASGGNTTYTGTFNGASVLPPSPQAGWVVIITGFSHASNNGTFVVQTGSTGTTMVVNNPNGVSESASGSAEIVYAPLTATSNLQSELAISFVSPSTGAPQAPSGWTQFLSAVNSMWMLPVPNPANTTIQEPYTASPSSPVADIVYANALALFSYNGTLPATTSFATRTGANAISYTLGPYTPNASQKTVLLVFQLRDVGTGSFTQKCVYNVADNQGNTWTKIIDSFTTEGSTGTDAGAQLTVFLCQNPVQGATTITCTQVSGPAANAVGNQNYVIGATNMTPLTNIAALATDFFTYVENTGTGNFTVESSAQIDGSSNSILLGPNSGMLFVFDGMNWFTVRGAGGSGGGLSLQQDGVALPTEPKLNFISPVTGADDPGNTSTDLSVKVFVGSGASHATGLVPDPGASAGVTRFLREDSSFVVPPTFVASGASHAPGYVPDPGASAGTTKFLREDATFVVPPNFTAFTRQTNTFATASVANGVTDSGTWVIAKTGYFIILTVDFDARVRLYSTAAAATADVGRSFSTPITAGNQNELIFDIQLTSTGVNPTGLTWVLSPAALGSNADGSVSTNLYYNVTNNSGSTRAIHATLTYLVLE